MPSGLISLPHSCAASTLPDSCGSPDTPRDSPRQQPRPDVRTLPAADSDAPWAATIVYGSQTGNGRRIAEALAQRLRPRGLRVRVLRAGEYAPRELARGAPPVRRHEHAWRWRPAGRCARASRSSCFGRRAPQLPCARVRGARARRFELSEASARSAAGSTSAWRSSARRGSSTASIATWTTKLAGRRLVRRAS